MPMSSAEDELMQAANALQSLPQPREFAQMAPQSPLQRMLRPEAQRNEVHSADEHRGTSESDESEDLEVDGLDYSHPQGDNIETFGSLVTDSYGKLR